MRYGVEERGPPAFAEDARDALEVSANSKQPHDQRCVGDQVPGSDDAAHSMDIHGNGFSKHISGHVTYMVLRPIQVANAFKCEMRPFAFEG